MGLVRQFVYKHPGLKLALVKVRDRRAARDYKRSYGDIYPVNEKQILFTAYSGRQYACSPKALYLELLENEAYADYKFVWAFLAPEDYPELAGSPRTATVVYDSPEYKRALAESGYWITNTRVPGYAVKKSDQTYVQTWHGTPLKRLGYDVEKYISGADDKESLRYSYRTDAARYDYLLSPSPYYTDHMSSAFGLKTLGKQHVMLELGYPRNDRLYVTDEAEKLRIRRQLEIPENRKVILYAPTWRETDLKPQEGYSYARGIDFHFGMDLEKFLKDLGPEYTVLVRTHYFVKKEIEDLCKHIDHEEDSAGLINVSDYKEINDLYIASDLLITDYSSVFFDYGILDRPIVFYMYDLDSYQNIRDFYIDIEELPGQIVTREKDLIGAVKRGMEEPIPDRTAFHEKFNPISGPCAAEVLEKIIKK